MSIFKKVASAFVEISPKAPEPDTESGEGQGGGGLDSITNDAAALLAQLEGPNAGSAGQAGQSAQPGQPAPSSLTMTADEVFRAAGLADGPNSAQRLLRVIGGLAMFPRDQQLAMVRAMDSADDSWAEEGVLTDAMQRQQALGLHLQRIAQERDSNLAQLAGQIEQTRQGGEAVLAELDKQIASLQKRRNDEAAATSTEMARLTAEQDRLRYDEEKARKGVSQVSQALQDLVMFFGGPGAPGGSKGRK